MYRSGFLPGASTVACEASGQTPPDFHKVDTRMQHSTGRVLEDIVAQHGDIGIAARSSNLVVWSRNRSEEPRTEQKEDTINWWRRVKSRRRKRNTGMEWDSVNSMIEQERKAGNSTRYARFRCARCLRTRCMAVDRKHKAESVPILALASAVRVRGMEVRDQNKRTDTRTERRSEGEAGQIGIITVHAGQEIEAAERVDRRKEEGCGFACEFAEARYRDAGIGRYCNGTVSEIGITRRHEGTGGGVHRSGDLIGSGPRRRVYNRGY
ncbi:hypothetical protein B0H13DRAFT_1888681 [Mycena leptocephala]|nr:hypothetical protein B0H13DRAFT_1888681 [Mycena leptocephala]